MGWRGRPQSEGPQGGVTPLNLCPWRGAGFPEPPPCGEELPGPCQWEEWGTFGLLAVDGGLSRQPVAGDTALGEGSPEEGYLVLLVS